MPQTLLLRCSGTRSLLLYQGKGTEKMESTSAEAGSNLPKTLYHVIYKRQCPHAQMRSMSVLDFPRLGVSLQCYSLA